MYFQALYCVLQYLIFKTNYVFYMHFDVMCNSLANLGVLHSFLNTLEEYECELLVNLYTFFAFKHMLFNSRPA